MSSALPEFDWMGFLGAWNRALLACGDLVLPDTLLARSWLGHPGATAAQLAAAEARLGTVLPPSYRTFLAATNGWEIGGVYCDVLWSTDELVWHAAHRADLIDRWVATGVTWASDDAYFVYGPEQSVLEFRTDYLYTALEVSNPYPPADGVYLLNPQVVTPEGEWEAWFFAPWLPGAQRYRSFWELMQAQYDLLQEVCAEDAEAGAGTDDVAE